MSFLTETETMSYKTKYHDPEYKSITANVMIVVFAIVFGVYAAWVFSYLWLWFIVPLGTPLIGVAHAYGLLLVKGFLLFKKESKEDATIGARIDAIILVAVGATIFLISGFIVNYFFM